MSGTSPLSSATSSSLVPVTSPPPPTSGPLPRWRDTLSTHQKSSLDLEMLRSVIEHPSFLLWKTSLFLRAIFNQQFGVNQVELNAPIPSWFTPAMQAQCAEHKLSLYLKHKNKDLSDLYFLELPPAIVEDIKLGKRCGELLSQIINDCLSKIASSTLTIHVTKNKPLSSIFVQALAVCLTEDKNLRFTQLDIHGSFKTKEDIAFLLGLITQKGSITEITIKSSPSWCEAVIDSLFPAFQDPTYYRTLSITTENNAPITISNSTWSELYRLVTSNPSITFSHFPSTSSQPPDLLRKTLVRKGLVFNIT